MNCEKHAKPSLEKAAKESESGPLRSPSNCPSAAKYAYGQPGQQIVAEDFHNRVRQLEPGVTIGGVSALKRLLFESQTQLLAILKE